MLTSRKVVKLSSLWQNPFSFLFSRPSVEDRLAAYVIREHERGRPLAEILEDPYIQNRATPQQRARLLDRPEIVRALGQTAITEARTLQD
jgi:hypothetical protein